MSRAVLSVRAYVRYAVPLTVMSAIVFAPLLYVAWHTRAPANMDAGKSAVRWAWGMLALAVPSLLVLVGGAAPLVRALAAGTPASQVRALRDGVRGLVGAAAPAVLAAIAALIGGLALVVPGLALLVLFGLVGASERTGAERLADAAEVARTPGTALAIGAVLVATFALHAAIVWFVQRGLAVPLPRKPTPQQLAALRALLRASATSIAVLAPVSAVALAAIYARARVTA